MLLVIGGAAGVGAAGVIATPNTTDRTAATAAAVLAVAAYGFCRTPLLHLAALGCIAVASAAWLSWAIPTVFADRPFPGGQQVSGPELAIGLCFATIAAAWALLAIKGVLDERQLGLTSAGALFFVGAEILATDSATGRAWTNGFGYILLGVLAVAVWSATSGPATSESSRSASSRWQPSSRRPSSTTPMGHWAPPGRCC